METLRKERADRFAALAHETNLRVEEIDEWKRAADSMYLPYDEQRGIHPQDDDFLERRPWDFDATPPEHYLLLHYHPLVIYRHQVIKQADVVSDVSARRRVLRRAEKVELRLQRSNDDRRLVTFRVHPQEVTYFLREGPELTIEHEGEEIRLTKGERVTRTPAAGP